MPSETAPRMTWEGAVEWARRAPEMADLIQICYYDDPIEDAARRFKASEEWQAIAESPAARAEQIGDRDRRWAGHCELGLRK